jgi:prepilin-type N-terminal cleavage/methylation domain-containing protein/prepilin-type processing-associated H-X9-DG protein
MTQRRSGFTLIELLVVIAIIAILAAMLFPVFARARESARKIQCLANVKNIATAVQMYLVDYDRFPPKNSDEQLRTFLNSLNPGRCDPGAGGRFQGANPYLRWPVILDEYIRNREVWQCPSIAHPLSAGWIVPQYTPIWWHYLVENVGHWGSSWTSNSNPDCSGGPCCRAWPSGWGGSVTDSIAQRKKAYDDPHSFLMGIDANSNCLMGRKTSEMDDASWWVVVADAQGAPGELNQIFGAAYGSNPGCCWGLEYDDCVKFFKDVSFRKKYAPHMGGLNIGFADGHAAWWEAEAAVVEAPLCQCCGLLYDCTQWVGHGTGKLKGLCPDYAISN